MQENGVLLMTVFSLQVTAKNGRAPEDMDAFTAECIQYWDGETAGAELQIALQKMSWSMSSCDAAITSPPSKKLKT